ncbi:MAG: hypothetical protein A3F33_03770 [Candidatus Woykebacteria bacterium RIFCSPHIGHO2_12_FULL_43_10]|uniref:Uncharacterized protein n=2 Tax=Candidatus Woykeibacteriota TaxID=1817899 RepID=A0A1G1WUA9_9BACT|nr:MAG: hypothetical protein A2802_01190 [Candidatus Woykebacteria bacterium RIFCSPHIGHO2_01_FULL_43_29]OGY28982.1 MAG: hypothetical protein A3J50_03785 [Candidatus Woykebacteria bacterium RIFCSPHIGHO2_02_FULL_43_16b]OGY30359.1 MAG: hypothetical protein A3F33_03770 [Candidatus Woykebacteria bacterium RIFCSPHIGHO2_12_FULL_43_10]OGY31304.1 MAG: hypothetical protein A3A61_02845 [Candidatus Woykebacteria bacterium RIFCSPLOWO2_01_FULL_43_14]
MFLRYAYVVFIGLLLAAFVGVGIAAFYPEPSYPLERPTSAKLNPERTLTATESAELDKQTQESFEKQLEFDKQRKSYARNVSLLTLLASLLVLTASMTILGRIYVISDGLLLGGILTLLYSIVRGFGAEDNMYRFIVISIGLVMSLLLGYLKMVRTESSK